jgi:hypothetical protein
MNGSSHAQDEAGMLMGPRFAAGDFQRGLEIALGAAYRRAADIGEVLATAGRIKDGNADSWLCEWTATAGTAWAAAREAAERAHLVTALAHYLRAATYYGTALCMVAHSSEPHLQYGLWRKQRICWDRAAELFPVPGERVAIPYQGTWLPGHLFRAPDAAAGQRRPLVVVSNGSGGGGSQAWVLGGAAAAERGYHWMTFDGPGQQAALFDQRIPFRPDWEAVLTPAVDAMIARGDVDARRIAVIGVSQAGYWIPRALAFEHRFAAAVADPGVVDVSTCWTEPLPPSMREQLERGERVAFDQEMHLAELFSPAMRATLRSRGEPYGFGADSRFALYRAICAYRLGDEVQQITTPLLVTDPEHEQFWPGQSQQLYDRLTGPRQIVRFTADDGAGRHGAPLGSALRESRIFDWLDEYLA